MGRGGRGKAKVSEDEKIMRILTILPHKDIIGTGKEIEPCSMSVIQRRALRDTSTNTGPLSKLLVKLIKTDNAYKRLPAKHERGSGFYYKTDKGLKTEDIFLKFFNFKEAAITEDEESMEDE